MLVWLLAWLAPLGDRVEVTSCAPPLQCEAVSRSGTADVEIEEVRARVDGVPLAKPVSRRLVAIDGRQIGPSRSIDVPKGSLPTARISADDAIAIAAASTQLVVESVELVADVRDGSLHPIWRVDPLPDPITLRHPWIYVDAVTGAVEVGPDRSVQARARLFARNPVLDAEAIDVELAFIDDGATALLGEYFHGTTCARPEEGLNCVYADVPPDADGNWLPPAPDISIAADNEDPEDAFSAVSVFAHADRFQQFAFEHGLGELSCPVSTLIANYRFFTNDGWISYGQATYTGDCSATAVFGQGSHADWGYDGDVVHHELTHGLVERLMGRGRFLGFRRDRGEAVLTDALALNEAIADFVAAAMSGDPAHAEYVREHGGGMGRDAANDFVCPDDIVGEVHYDSEIVSGALWSAYERIGVDLVRAIVLAVALLEEDTTFEEASAIFVQVVRDELGQGAADILAEELAARGLDDCPRIAAWHRVERPLWIHPMSQPGASYEPMRPPAVQLAFTMPPDGRKLRVHYDVEVLPLPGWAPVSALNVIANVGRPLAFEYLPIESKTIVTAEMPDVHVADANAGFEIEAGPGETVYVAFFNLHVTTLLVTGLTAEFETESGSGSGSESDSDSESESDSESDSGSGSGSGSASITAEGCSCATAPATPWLILLIGAIRARGRSRGRLRSGCSS